MEHILNIFNGSLTQSAVIFITTLIFVLLAEMGDKTQLIVMAFATRYKLRQVITGVIISLILLNGLAVIMGELLTTVIPITYIQVLASIAFIIFGLMAFRKEDDRYERERLVKISSVLTVALSFFVAELGDKTQLATMAFSAEYRAPFEVFTGAFIGMLIADMLGLAVGVALNKYISPKVIKIVSGLLFIGFGLIGLGSLIPQDELNNILQSIVFMIGIGALSIIFYLIYAPKFKKCKGRG